MVNGKRFEDSLPLEEFMKEPAEVLLAKIYAQTLKTNGTVVAHSKEIEDLQTTVKSKAGCTEFESLALEVKDKIGTKELLRFEKFMGVIAGVIGFIMIVFNIWDRIAG